MDKHSSQLLSTVLMYLCQYHLKSFQGYLITFYHNIIKFILVMCVFTLVLSPSHVTLLV